MMKTDYIAGIEIRPGGNVIGIEFLSIGII
jgi:hypothetical protein